MSSNVKSYYRSIKSSDRAPTETTRDDPFKQRTRKNSSVRTRLEAIPSFRFHYLPTPKAPSEYAESDLPDLFPTESAKTEKPPSKALTLAAETATEKPQTVSSFATTNPHESSKHLSLLSTKVNPYESSKHLSSRSTRVTPHEHSKHLSLLSTEVNPPDSVRGMDSTTTTRTIRPVSEESQITDMITPGGLESDISYAREPSYTVTRPGLSPSTPKKSNPFPGFVIAPLPRRRSRGGASNFGGTVPSRPIHKQPSQAYIEMRKFYAHQDKKRALPPVADSKYTYREIVYNTEKEKPRLIHVPRQKGIPVVVPRKLPSRNSVPTPQDINHNLQSSVRFISPVVTYQLPSASPPEDAELSTGESVVSPARSKQGYAPTQDPRNSTSGSDAKRDQTEITSIPNSNEMDKFFPWGPPPYNFGRPSSKKTNSGVQDLLTPPVHAPDIPNRTTIFNGTKAPTSTFAQESARSGNRSEKSGKTGQHQNSKPNSHISAMIPTDQRSRRNCLSIEKDEDRGSYRPTNHGSRVPDSDGKISNPERNSVRPSTGFSEAFESRGFRGASVFSGDAHSRPTYSRPMNNKLMLSYPPAAPELDSQVSEYENEPEPVDLIDRVETTEIAERQASRAIQIPTPRYSETPSRNISLVQKEPQEMRATTITAPDGTFYVGAGSRFWHLPDSPNVQWSPISVIGRMLVKNVYFSDISEDTAPLFRYPQEVVEVHFDGAITQRNFARLLSELYQLRTLELHISNLHHLRMDRFNVKSLEFPLLKSLEVSMSGFTERDTAVFNLSQIFTNTILILSLTFPALSYVGVSMPFVPDLEKKFMIAMWHFVLNHRETLEILSIEFPFPDMGPQLRGYRRFFPRLDPDIVEMDITGAKEVKLTSFHMFYFTKVGSSEFWRRFIKTQEKLEYIQFWCEGRDYYKFPYDIIRNNAAQLQTVSMNIDLRSYPDRYTKVPIDFAVFQSTPFLKTLALKGSLLEHLSPKNYLKPDIVNVESLPNTLEIIKLMNLNVGADDIEYLALENPNLKSLYLDNIGTDGRLGITVGVIVTLLDRSSQSPLEKLEIFDSVNQSSLWGSRGNNNMEKGYRLILRLLQKKRNKPSLKAYRAPDDDFEIIYEDDDLPDGTDPTYNYNKNDDWAERELKSKSYAKGGRTRSILSSVFRQAQQEDINKTGSKRGSMKESSNFRKSRPQISGSQGSGHSRRSRNNRRRSSTAGSKGSLGRKSKRKSGKI